MNTNLDCIRIVLVRTSLPANIGAAARAMKTMGLVRLTLVDPKTFPHPDAMALASGAGDLLDRATVVSTLPEALVGTTRAYALTARSRQLSHPAYELRAAAAETVAELDVNQGEVAMVFGTEMSGLSNDEVMQCQRLVHIPTSADFSSINLAQAVQLVAYELRMAATERLNYDDSARFPAAPHDDVERFYAHLELALVMSGFLDPHNPRRLMERMRRLFSRTRLEQEEINILRGAIASFEGRFARSQSSD